jgi:hypothetical protein
MGNYQPQKVYRSGMGSNENPLNNTKEYYPQTNTASRGGLSSSMYSKAANQGDPNSELVKQENAQYSKTANVVGPKGSFMGVKGPQVIPKF